MRLLLFILLALLLCTGAVRAEVPPPFGFRWNDPAPKVEQVLNHVKAKIVNREQKENREYWTVEGLKHTGLKRTVFGFKEQFLVEVELQYEFEKWAIEDYNDYMGRVRRAFEAKYGTGKLVTRTRDMDTDIIQTLVGYRWNVDASTLELFYFSAERPPNVYRTITVTYKVM
jgi:hypothetical protein